MRAILLAAGKGSRISKSIQDVPKSTLLIDNKPLIRRTVEMLSSLGISSTVCVGYKKEAVFKALEGLDYRSYYNPFFDVTNSIASLWFAKEVLDDDLIIMNADVYISADIINGLIDDKRGILMLGDKTTVETGDYFFTLNDKGCIVGYGKGIPLSERSCEYVGVAKISAEFLSMFKDMINRLIDQQKHNCWWEDVIYSLSKDNDIPVKDVEGKFWSEIDYYDDYQKILNHVNGNIKE